MIGSGDLYYLFTGAGAQVIFRDALKIYFRIADGIYTDSYNVGVKIYDTMLKFTR